MMSKNNPLFITFEGGEGAGKTTLIDKVEQTLIEKGYDVVRTREPGGAKLSNHIRQWLLQRDSDVQVGHQAELLLFLAARSQHIEELIQPALKQGKIVICDRFNDSTVVYQGIARGLGLEATHLLCELVTKKCQPNLTIFVDVDPKVGLERTRKAQKENAKEGEIDRIEAESIEFHTKVREGFLQLAKKEPQRIQCVNGNLSPEEVFQDTLKIFETVL